MKINLNSGYGGAQASGIPFTTGKVFFVDDSGGANFNNIEDLYIPDPDGVTRRFSTVTLALAACVVGHGDIIVLAPDFSTTLTATELLAAETKGVAIITAQSDKNGVVTAYAPDAAIAGASDKSLFTVTGLIEMISIIGKVGTVIETQANNTLLKINPTNGADVDLCAALDISAAAAKTFLTITGTVGDAMIATASGAVASQASSLVVDAGIIELETAADNTGTIKWMIKYKPLEPGARVFAA